MICVLSVDGGIAFAKVVAVCAIPVALIWSFRNKWLLSPVRSLGHPSSQPFSC